MPACKEIVLNCNARIQAIKTVITVKTVSFGFFFAKRRTKKDTTINPPHISENQSMGRLREDGRLLLSHKKHFLSPYKNRCIPAIIRNNNCGKRYKRIGLNSVSGLRIISINH